MPTIVEELTVTLGLDASGLRRGLEDAKRALDKIGQDVGQETKKLEDASNRAIDKIGEDASRSATKRADEVSGVMKKLHSEMETGAKNVATAFKPLSDVFHSLRTEFLAFIGITSLSIAGLERLFNNISAQTTAFTRNAMAVGTSAEALMKWKLVAEATGGTAEDAVQTLDKISQSMARLRQFGERDDTITAIGEFLGRSINRNEDPAKLLDEIFKARTTFRRGMSEPDFLAWANRMGIARSIAQSTPETRERMGREAADLAPTAEQAAKFQKLNEVLAVAQERINSIWRTLMADFAPQIEYVIGLVDAWVRKNHEWLEQKIEETVKNIWTEIKELATQAKDAYTWIDQLVTKMGGWKAVLTDLGIAFVAFKGLQVASMFFNIARSIAAMTGALNAIPVGGGLGLGSLLPLLLPLALKGDEGPLSPEDQKKKDERTDQEWENYKKTHPDAETSARKMIDDWRAAHPGENLPPEMQKWESRISAAPSGGGARPEVLKPMTAAEQSQMEEFALHPPSTLGPMSVEDMFRLASSLPAQATASRSDYSSVPDSKRVPSSITTANEKTAYDILMGTGHWTPEQAAGIIANLDAESGLDPSAVGDNGQAYGIAQWHPDRQENFTRAGFGNIRGSSLEQQVKFVDWELTHGELAAGNILSKQTTAQSAGAAVSIFYERPGDREGQARKRAGDAPGVLRRVTGSAPAATTPSSTASQTRGLVVPPGADTSGLNLGSSVKPPRIGPHAANSRVGAGVTAGGTALAMNSSTNTVNIGTVNVHTQATDAPGIARDIGAQLKRYAHVSQANYGLA